MGRTEPLLPRWTDGAVRGVITARWSTECCGGYGPGLLGATCPSGTGRGRPSTSGSPAGRPMARGRSCWSMSRSMMTRGGGWGGSSPLTPRSTGPISTPRARVEGDAGRDELEDPGRSQAHQALGRSRGGLTAKVHLAVDGRGLPLSIVLTPGNVNDATAFADVLDGVRTPRVGTGRPRTTPDRVLGDKAYSSRAIRHLLRRRGHRRHDPRAPRPGGQPPTQGALRWPATRL